MILRVLDDFYNLPSDCNDSEEAVFKLSVNVETNDIELTYAGGKTIVIIDGFSYEGNTYLAHKKLVELIIQAFLDGSKIFDFSGDNWDTFYGSYNIKK